MGAYFTGTAYQTFILHWKGAGWKRVKSPNVGGSSNGNTPRAVSAASATSAWAVGVYSNVIAAQTLALRWNGKAWRRVQTPNPAGASRDDVPLDVVALSAKNAWAVGYFVDPTNTQTLLLHWNGKAWKRVKSPNPGGDAYTNIFWGVDGASATDLWMVGSHSTGVIGEAMAVHCC